MRIINRYTHPIHGNCYLWEESAMNYRIGTVATNYAKFDGWTYDEVVEKINEKGFRVLPWNP